MRTHTPKLVVLAGTRRPQTRLDEIKPRPHPTPRLSCPILSYPYPILSCPVLSYPTLSYPILSQPSLTYAIVDDTTSYVRCVPPQNANMM